ncbi:hypothetical protein B0H17DRAFT_1128022 [Mycena rosella]|uniref:Uncharacterized protein n=1 Tax=Mycena rosella TaxID=1033263 RepID=A0AAD7DZN3_MYCRO|nr:hypothetical protein B0H17DRAFT_1128022 [Mycena rosella]
MSGSVMMVVHAGCGCCPPGQCFHYTLLFTFVGRQPMASQEIVSAAIQKTLISCLPLLLHCKLGALAGTPAVLVAQVFGRMTMVPARAVPVSSWGLPQTTVGSTDSHRRERAVHHKTFGPTTGISFARGLHNSFTPGGGGQVQMRKGQPRINHTVTAPAATISISFAIYPISLLHLPQEVDSALFDFCPYLYPNQAEFRIEGNGSALFGKPAAFNLLFTLEVPADAGPFYQELHQRLVDHMDNNNLHFAPGSLPLMPNTHPIYSPPWHMQCFEELPWALQKAGNTPTKAGFARRFVPADISWHQFTSESLPKAAKPFLSPILNFGALLRAPVVSVYSLQQMVPPVSSSTAPLFILDSPKLPLAAMEDDNDNDPDFLQALALSRLDAVAVSNTQAGGSRVGNSSHDFLGARGPTVDSIVHMLLGHIKAFYGGSPYLPANPADAAMLRIPPGPFGLMSPTLNWMIGNGGSDTSSGISLGCGIGRSVMEGLMNVIFADEDIWKRVRGFIISQLPHGIPMEADRQIWLKTYGYVIMLYMIVRLQLPIQLLVFFATAILQPKDRDTALLQNGMYMHLTASSLTKILEAWPETVSELAKPNTLLNMTQESYNAFGRLVQRRVMFGEDTKFDHSPDMQMFKSTFNHQLKDGYPLTLGKSFGTSLLPMMAKMSAGRLQKVEDLVACLHWIPCSDRSLVDLEEKYKAAFIDYISAPGIVRYPLLPVARLMWAEHEITASNLLPEP